MSTASKLLEYLAKRGWVSSQIENDDYQLEIHPVPDMQEAAFTLWQRRPGGRLDLVASGHTYGDDLFNAENRPLDLPATAQSALDDLIAESTDDKAG